jgi:protein involved in polysaccharide export with SLBB domain
MKAGKRWSSWKTPATGLALALLAIAPGCARDRFNVEKNLMSQKSDLHQQEVRDRYRVGCPDILDVTLPHHPEISGEREIGPDGRMDLGEYGALRVEGRTIPEIIKLLTEEIGASPEGMKVHVAEYRSQHILLFGEVIGWQRSIPYRGQETVLELLQRVGGITSGAAPKDVFVVRPHLGESRRPEALHVDLHAIVLKHDHRTNIRLMPYDQVYVGETRQAQVERAIPPWLRGAYQTVWHSRPDPARVGPKD